MNRDSTAIACIAWGSVVYSPRDLPCLGPWNTDGPLLPVEFARQSADGRLTLVICPNVLRVQTCWCLLSVTDLDEARRALGVREYKRATRAWIDQYIGFWNSIDGSSFGLESETVARWAKEHEVAGAVWTSLPCKFHGVSGLMPSAEEVLGYLEQLEGKARDEAEAYVRKAPAQIATAYRRMLERELGWTPSAA